MCFSVCVCRCLPHVGAWMGYQPPSSPIPPDDDTLKPPCIISLSCQSKPLRGVHPCSLPLICNTHTLRECTVTHTDSLIRHPTIPHPNHGTNSGIHVRMIWSDSGPVGKMSLGRFVLVVVMGRVVGGMPLVWLLSVFCPRFSFFAV